MSDKALMHYDGDDSLQSMMKAAVEKGPEGVETLERLMALQERLEARHARSSFVAALSALQGEMPSIPPNRKGAHGVAYADREQVMRHLQPLLTKYGLAVTFDGEQDAEGYTAICTVTHVDGHSERNRFRVPREKASNRMNVSQAEGSASEYAMRYALKSALNLRTGDRDDDGHAAGQASPISDEQAANIEALLDEVNADRERFFKWAGVESVADMPESKYGAAINMLERKRD